MPVITGTPDNDVLTGTSGDDEINGLEGADTINGGLGVDILSGGAGDDVFLFTEFRRVPIPPYPDAGRIDGGAGRDTLDATATGGSVGYNSGTGNWSFIVGTQIFLFTGIERILFGADSQGFSMTGASSIPLEIRMGGGADTGRVYAGVSFFAEDGDDTVSLTGSDGPTQTHGSADGGAGVDRLELNIMAVADLAAGTVVFEATTFAISGFENASVVVSNGFDGTIRGDAGANTLGAYRTVGAAGRAWLEGRGGDDFLFGAEGNDTLLGGDGDDLMLGRLGDDLIDGGSGFDTADYQYAANGVRVDLALSGAQNTGEGSDTLISIEGIVGSGFDDFLYGAASADLLRGGAGRDVLDGRGGDDMLEGGDGDDDLVGGVGNDRLDGGAGNDTLRGGDGDDVLLGGDGNDTLRETSGNDRLIGGTGNDLLDIYREAGASGDFVRMEGGDGVDRLQLTNVTTAQVEMDGGTGNDIFLLSYLSGTTTITTGLGSDLIYVGRGINAALLVADFTAGNQGDTLHLGYNFAELINWDGSNPFGTGHLRLVQSGADTLVQADRDGRSGAGEFATLLTLQNVQTTSLTTFNFSGLAPDGGRPPATVTTGTAGNDSIRAGDGDDIIDLLGGDDEAFGGGGNDRLDGGIGNDRLWGELGDDVLLGGDGNDVLRDISGADILIGGAGNDTLDVNRGATASGDLVRMEGGDGTDRLELTNVTTARVEMDGGTGNDTIIVRYLSGATTVTTGLGSDLIYVGLGINAALVFTDFTAGNQGDVLYLGTNFTDSLTNWSGSDPFSTGHLRLVQSGADTLVQVDRDGRPGAGEFATLLTLQNVLADNLTTFNFSGLNPESARPPGLALTGTVGNDTLRGGDGHDVINGSDGDDDLAGDRGNDRLDGGAGADLITGGSGDDTLTGGEGDDRLDGGEGVDTGVYFGQRSAYTISNVNGVTTIAIGQTVDTLTNIEFVQFADQRVTLSTSVASGVNIVGTAGRDTLTGTASADIIAPGGGIDIIDGGGGVDTLLLPNPAGSYFFEQTDSGWIVYDGTSDFDVISNVEQVQFGSGPATTIAAAAVAGFDPFNYLAGYPDLLGLFSPPGAYRHYVAWGQAEGRPAAPFDTMAYIASNPDLIPVFQNDLRGAVRHYVWAGAGEGRPTHTFNALLYAASNPDLALAFGADAAAATSHYVNVGFAQGRATTTFNVLQYIASNEDLARVFGNNPTAGLNHYVTMGVRETRAFNTFDARQYAAANADVAALYGVDEVGARAHYLNVGAVQYRATSGFDPVAYLLSNADIAGRNADAALEHWLTIGAAEGRAGDAAFGRDQTSHSLPQSGFNSTVLTLGDRDWFSIGATAGERVTINLNSSFRGGIQDGALALYDSLGRLIATDPGASPEARATITFTAATAGVYYLVVWAPDNSNGSYGLSLFRTQAAALVADKPSLEDGPQVLPGAPDGGSADDRRSHLLHDQAVDLLDSAFVFDFEAGAPGLQATWLTDHAGFPDAFQADAQLVLQVGPGLDPSGIAWEEAPFQPLERHDAWLLQA